MGMFDVQLSKELNLKKNQKDLYEFLKKQLCKEKEYHHTLDKDKLTISKNPVGTFLKYNVNVEYIADSLFVEAELDNNQTLIITVLIILSILLTYGIAIVPIVGFVYYQKVIAKRYIESLIKNYGYID